MPVSTVEIRSVAGTQAALGWADSHTIVVDRPAGRAGGMGLGFNGAQLLGLSIGGCFANDLRYVAADLGAPIAEISISVAVMLSGDPVLATGAAMRVAVSIADGSDPAPLIDRVKAISMAMNSLQRGMHIELTL